MTDQLGPDSLRALKKQIGWSDTPAKIDAHAAAWDDDIWREDVYDKNYRKELAKNAALRERLEEAEKDRAWLIEWHRIWHRPGSLLRWAALTAHRMRVPKPLGVLLDMNAALASLPEVKP